MNRIVGVALTFVGAFGFYLFLAGTIDAVEVAVGIVSAAAAALIATGMNHVAQRHYAFAPPTRALLRPVASLIPEALVVGRILGSVALSGAVRQRGDFVQQPFDSGDQADATTRGRRALSVIGISLAPRTFVVRGEAAGTLLLHGLPAKAISTDTRWPA